MKINPKEILKAASELANSFKNSEKLPIPLLAVRAKKAAMNHPEDQTLIMLANVLTKMSENNKIFITRAEFNNVYSKFATSNTMACEYFKEELNINEDNADRQVAGYDDGGISSLYSSADQSLSNALAELWDDSGKSKKNGELKLYNPNQAKHAENLTKLELTRLGCEPKEVVVFSGTEDLIICQAKYETPKGVAYLLVPVELISKGALTPTIFATKFGFADLNREAIEEYIQYSAGKNMLVKAENIINTLKTIKQANVLSEFELKVLAAKESLNNKKLHAEVENQKNMSFASSAILMQEVDIENTQAETSVPKFAETETFATKLNTPKGTAEFIFGKQVVDNGRNAIISKLASLGYNAKATISSCGEDCIMYAVSMNTAKGDLGFEVVAEVNNNKAIIPAIIAVKDKPYDFSAFGINELVRDQSTDFHMVAVVSPMFEMKSSELVEIIEQSAKTGDYKKAEEALIILSEKDNEDAYMKATALYLGLINNKSSLKKQASKCGCSKVIKVATHLNPICGHLNLPLDKVYQNERGECCPLYRKNMQDTYDGVLLNSHKIF